MHVYNMYTYVGMDETKRHASFIFDPYACMYIYNIHRSHINIFNWWIYIYTYIYTYIYIHIYIYTYIYISLNMIMQSSIGG